MMLKNNNKFQKINQKIKINNSNKEFHIII